VGVVVTLGLRARRRSACSGCGARGLLIKEHREKSWRHLDLGASRCYIECRLRRLYCPGCGDVYEAVRWARTGAPYTRDFEDVCAFLAQQMADAAGQADADRVAVGRQHPRDEVSHGADHKFLTCVADHTSGEVVWAAPGRNAQTLQGFFAQLTDEQKDSITAVSIDMSAGYEKAIRAPEGLPNAQVCFDPFHVCQLGGKAADQVRRTEYNRHGRSCTGEGKWIKGTRYSLLKNTANQTPKQLAKLADVVLTNKSMYRAFLLLGELRYIYRLPKHEAADRLDAWLAWASRSKLKPFIKLARTIRKHKAGVLAAIQLAISNGRLEALNSRVRLISHRAHGFHSPDALIAMIYLCCAGVQIDLPHR